MKLPAEYYLTLARAAAAAAILAKVHMLPSQLLHRFVQWKVLVPSRVAIIRPNSKRCKFFFVTSTVNQNVAYVFTLVFYHPI